MAITIGDAILYIIGDDKGLNKTLDGVQGKIDKSMAGIQNKLNTWGNRLTVGLTMPIVAMGGVAVKNASDLEETITKTGVVFGDAADDVLAFGEDAAKSLGMSKNEALAAAATYGNLLRATGLASGESAEMSTNLVQLAGDLASFNNMDPSEVLTKLRAGLTGESEPLKTLGINMNEARLKAKAMELGLYDGVGALDAAAKAQAAYAIMVEDSSLAQGDFERTSDGVANQTRILKAQFEDMSAELGTNLLPALKIALEFLNTLLEAFNKLGPGAQKAVMGFLLLLAAIGPVMKIGAGLISVFGSLSTVGTFLSGTVLPAIGGALAAVSLPVLALVAAIGALIAVIVIFGEDAWNSLKMLAELAGAIFKRMIDDIVNWSKQIMTYVKKTATTLGRNAKVWFQSVGKSIVTGLWTGVKNSWSWLTSQISSNMDSLLASVKSKLGISSPSQLFADEIGAPLAQGVGAGFQTEALNAVAQMAQVLSGVPTVLAGSGGGNISIGHVEYHGRFSQSELAYLDRRQERMAETVTLKALRRLE